MHAASCCRVSRRPCSTDEITSEPRSDSRSLGCQKAQRSRPRGRTEPHCLTAECRQVPAVMQMGVEVKPSPNEGHGLRLKLRSGRPGFTLRPAAEQSVREYAGA